jgi:prepilin-type N-terminal cleavage/methylation domain-containing protein
MHIRIKNNHSFLFKITRGHLGFTLIELLFAILILAVLVMLAFPLYSSYIQKAKMTIGVAALDRIQKSLESYHLDNNKYPDSINFSTCMDDQGHSVFPSDFCDQLKQDIFSFDSYTIDSGGYTLKAQAIDNKHTKLILTPSKNTKEGT